MKQLLLLCGLMAFTGHERMVKVELSETKWKEDINKLLQIRAYAESSNLPHQDVLTIEANIDAVTGDILPQVFPKADTTKPKK